MITPRWSESLGAISPRLLGHNAVWCRGGLGVWSDAARAFVPEVLEAVRAVRPAVLRFPGGTRAMRWQFDETIGPYDRRRAQCDPFRGALDATSYGLDEGLAFAEAVGAETALVAPWVDGSPEETAALVAYVNGDPAHDVAIGTDGRGKNWGGSGDWARRRVANGRERPWDVRFLEIGNEPYLGLPVGPPSSCGRPTQFRQCEQWIGDRAVPTTAARYADALVRTAALVRAIDPAIRIGAAAIGGLFDHEDARTEIGAVDLEVGTNDPWNPRLLASAADAFDHWIVHPYVLEPTDARLRLGERLRKVVRELRALDPKKPIAVTEHGFLFGGDTIRSAIASVDVVRVALEERLEMALRHLLIEDDPSGPFANAAMILGPERRRTPAWHATRLLRDALDGAEAVPCEGAIAARRGDAVVVVVARAEAGSVAVALPPGAWTVDATVLSAPALDAKDVAIAERRLGGPAVEVAGPAVVLFRARPRL